MGIWTSCFPSMLSKSHWCVTSRTFQAHKVETIGVYSSNGWAENRTMHGSHRCLFPLLFSLKQIFGVQIPSKSSALSWGVCNWNKARAWSLRPRGAVCFLYSSSFLQIPYDFSGKSFLVTAVSWGSAWCRYQHGAGGAWISGCSDCWGEKLQAFCSCCCCSRCCLRPGLGQTTHYKLSVSLGMLDQVWSLPLFGGNFILFQAQGSFAGQCGPVVVFSSASTQN